MRLSASNHVMGCRLERCICLVDGIDLELCIHVFVWIVLGSYVGCSLGGMAYLGDAADCRSLYGNIVDHAEGRTSAAGRYKIVRQM